MKEKRISLTLPQSWNELNDAQLEKIASLLHSGLREKEFDLQVFKILASATKENIRAANLVLQQVPLSELKKHYDFIYTQANRTAFIKKFTAGDKILYAPMDGLINLTADEFAQAEGFYQLWIKEKHRRALEYLAAVLYADSSGVRHAFNKFELDSKALPFAAAPLSFLLATELAYTGCKAGIVKRFPKAFPKGSGKSGGGKNYGFGKVILQMAGGKFGSHAETCSTNLYTFLEEFEDNLKNQK